MAPYIRPNRSMSRSCATVDTGGCADGPAWSAVLIALVKLTIADSSRPSSLGRALSVVNRAGFRNRLFSFENDSSAFCTLGGIPDRLGVQKSGDNAARCEVIVGRVMWWSASRIISDSGGESIFGVRGSVGCDVER